MRFRNAMNIVTPQDGLDSNRQNSAEQPSRKTFNKNKGKKNKGSKKPVLALSAQDLMVITTIGACSLFALSALSRQPIGILILTALVFVGFCSVYIKFARPVKTQRFEQKRETSPRMAAITGEARLADGFAEAVIIIGPEQKIEHANPIATELLGIKGPLVPVTTVIRNPDIIDMINRVLEGHNCEPVTYHIETPVDKYFRTLASPIASTFGDNAKRRALVVFYNVTDIVRSNDLRSDFLANASHELKTPIASLLGYIETMQGHAKNDEAARERFLKIMQTQAERMQRLIDDLLSLRRIEQAEHIAPTDKADLVLATHAAIQALTPLADRRHVDIRIQGPETAMVIGVHDQLVQLILNLIANALHISPAKSIIDIKLDHIENRVTGKEFEGSEFDTIAAVKRRICSPEDFSGPVFRLRIRDYGRGFDREHIPRIGERFYRVAGDRENKERGTGLGLAIVKHIVLGHRGGLYVESARNVGTEFTALLPAAHNNTKP